MTSGGKRRIRKPVEFSNAYISQGLSCFVFLYVHLLFYFPCVGDISLKPKSALLYNLTPVFGFSFL